MIVWAFFLESHTFSVLRESRPQRRDTESAWHFPSFCWWLMHHCDSIDIFKINVFWRATSQSVIFTREVYMIKIYHYSVNEMPQLN